MGQWQRKKRKNESSPQTTEDLGSVNWGTVKGTKYSGRKVNGTLA